MTQPVRRRLFRLRLCRLQLFQLCPLGTLGALGALIFLLVAPDSADGQYFGRNKVIYETFDYRVLKTHRFDVHYTADKYPPEARAIHDAGRMAERWRARLDSVTGRSLSERKSVILYANQTDFHQTNVVSGLGEGTGGVTEGLRTRLIMPLTGSYADTDHVLGHELAHVYQYDIAKDTTSLRRGLQAMSRLPLWFVEGMAEYVSIGSEHPQTGVWLRDALLHDRLPTIQDLSRRPNRYFPYRWGHAFWAYVAGTRGDSIVPELYHGSLRRGVPTALEAREDVESVAALSNEWKAAIRERYQSEVDARTRPEEAGSRVLAPDLGAGSMNLSPTLSPNGRYVAYLSEQDLFSIELFIADAETGETVARLSSSTTSPHFNALRFIESAGAWSPTGDRFAYPVVRAGRNEIAVFDVSAQRVARRVRIAGVEEISHVAWAPSGDVLVISGMADGQSDLYRVELGPGGSGGSDDSGSPGGSDAPRVSTTDAPTTRLTNDRHADLQPEFSPDGSRVAFATDRGSDTSFDRLEYGAMRLGVLELADGSIETYAPFPNASHVNPQYGPEGDLFFISDRDGVPDVYRWEPGADRTFRVTGLATGVTGITPLSPALTVARESGRMLFSVFEDTDYVIYGRPPEGTRGEEVESVPDAPGRHPLPVAVPAAFGDRGETASPEDDRDSESSPVDSPVGAGPSPEAPLQLVDRLLADPRFGLPGFRTWEVQNYRPRLSLDYVAGSGGVGVGTGGFFGTQVGASGSVFMSFSDELGDHNLGAVLYGNGTFRDLGAYTYYVNQRRRWNWGGSIGHIPSRQSYTQYGVDENGRPFVGILDYRQFYDQAAAFTAYPFDPFTRVEFEVGYLRLGSNLELTRYFYGSGGQDRVELESPDPIHLAHTSTALIGDRSLFGFTSPIQGYRYHLEAQPATGTFSTVGVIADARKYVFQNPLTLAFRGLHWAEYDLTERPSGYQNAVFLGYGQLLRGYGYWSFDPEECPTTGRACPAIDRLSGTRALVSNLELRLPLLGNDQFGVLDFPYLPTELSLFLDAGLAWTHDEPPTFELSRTSSERVPVFSSGVSFRVNLFGYLVLEPYYAYPFQRPEKGWHWGLVLAPGW